MPDHSAPKKNTSPIAVNPNEKVVDQFIEKIKKAADEFRTVYEQIVKLQSRKDELTKTLRKLNVSTYGFGDKTLFYEIKRGKLLSLKNMTKILGGETANQIWKKLPDSVSGWYTIRKVGKQIKVKA